MQLSEMIQLVLTEAAEAIPQGADPEVSFDVHGRFAALTGVEISPNKRHITLILEHERPAGENV
jgi:hypothetical protein